MDMCHHLVGGLYVRIVSISFSWNVVTSLTPAARLWRLQHVPVNCFLSPLAVTVQDIICQLSSYNECALRVPLVRLTVGLFGPVHDLVGLLAWSVILLGSLKLACGGCPETPVSYLVEHGRRLIWPESLKDGYSAMRPGPAFPRGCYSDGVASPAWATSQRGPHIVPTACNVSLSD